MRSAIAWLGDYGLDAKTLGDLFNANPNHIRQLIHRGRRGNEKQLVPPILNSFSNLLQAPSARVRDFLGIRRHEDAVVLDGAEMRRLDSLSAIAEARGAEFWTGVRFETGLARYRSLLPLIGYPAHYRRIRLLARLRQLIAETHLHSGRAGSAVFQGMQSLLLSAVAYHESEDPQDVSQFGRTARLISQAYLLRAEPETALHYLDIYKQACERLAVALRPEFHHQLGTVHLLAGEDELANRFFQRAMEVRAETFDYGRAPDEREVFGIGLRQRYLVNRDWARAQELEGYMHEAWPEGDIHVGINVSWAVATAFQTDSDMVQQAGTDLLNRRRGTMTGFGRQATIAELLALTPKLPKGLRPAWARYSLYQNAFRDS